MNIPNLFKHRMLKYENTYLQDKDILNLLYELPFKRENLLKYY